MSKLKWTAVGALAVAALMTTLAAAFVAGYVRGQPELQPAEVAQRVMARLGLSPAQGGDSETPAQERYTSTFLTLRSESISVPGDLNRPGGGLTSLGRDVVLLTAEGEVFAATPRDGLRALSVSVPDNGYEAYVRAAESDRFAHLTFHLGLLRYNDVLYYDSPLGRALLISYTEYFDGAACYGTTLASLALGDDMQSAAELEAAVEDWTILYRSRPCLPLKEDYYALEGDLAGGRMAFAAPSSVYLANGDYRWDGMLAPRAVAQLDDWEYGKVMAIDVATGEARVFSKGHRNPQGIAVDGAGSLWVVEHGPRGGDELNHVREGRDYGWPSETLGTMYSGLPVPHTISYGRHDTFEPPAFAWLPSVAPSALAPVNGFHSTWDGDLLMTTLSAQQLYRIRIHDGRPQFAEPIDIGKRLRHVHQHEDGRLVLWTDTRELVFLSVEERGAELSYLEEQIAENYEEPLARSVRQALEGCLECHALVPDVHERAPSLASVYGADIAATSFAGYSDALRAIDGRWTRAALLDYLHRPQEFAPGTTMPDPGYEDDALLHALIDLLAALEEPSDA